MTNTNNTQHDYFQRMLRRGSAFCFVYDYIRWIKGHFIEELAMRKMGRDWHPEYTKHGNIVVYLGPKVEEFMRKFSKFGVILCRMKS